MCLSVRVSASLSTVDYTVCSQLTHTHSLRLTPPVSRDHQASHAKRLAVIPSVVLLVFLLCYYTEFSLPTLKHNRRVCLF